MGTESCPNARIRLTSELAKWKRNAIILAVVGLLAGLGFGLAIPALINQPFEPVPFNPTIDGIWDENEGWDSNVGIAWAYAEYIIPDNDHMKAENFYYSHLDLEAGLLYYLADICSDGTNETTEEFFSFWYDGNDTFDDVHNTDESWNMHTTDPDYSNEMFCYLPETDTFNSSLWLYSTKGWQGYDTTLDETDVQIAYGFQNTTNARFEHRIYEMAIEIDALRMFNDGEKFNFAFLGYGTLIMYMFYNSGFWSAPTDFGWNMYCNGVIDEHCYFRSGTAIEGDLWNIPTEFYLEPYPIL